ncbi:MAG: hypothetical protein EZS28_005527 [Streblomastix strix]|uniref:Uncharacterized protein n=1 Tax=Streblomastix strix TaxID=222440 RepID=A0A5J4WX73_9EUKA|nr:MAG: hypothetical protein EZS28_005527 [Streblomastix strix]
MSIPGAPKYCRDIQLCTTPQTLQTYKEPRVNEQFSFKATITFRGHEPTFNLAPINDTRKICKSHTYPYFAQLFFGEARSAPDIYFDCIFKGRVLSLIGGIDRKTVHFHTQQIIDREKEKNFDVGKWKDKWKNFGGLTEIKVNKDQLEKERDKWAVEMDFHIFRTELTQDVPNEPVLLTVQFGDKVLIDKCQRLFSDEFNNKTQNNGKIKEQDRQSNDDTSEDVYEFRAKCCSRGDKLLQKPHIFQIISLSDKLPGLKMANSLSYIDSNQLYGYSNLSQIFQPLHYNPQFSPPQIESPQNSLHSQQSTTAPYCIISQSPPLSTTPTPTNQESPSPIPPIIWNLNQSLPRASITNQSNKLLHRDGRIHWIQPGGHNASHETDEQLGILPPPPPLLRTPKLNTSTHSSSEPLTATTSSSSLLVSKQDQTQTQQT